MTDLMAFLNARLDEDEATVPRLEVPKPRVLREVEAKRRILAEHEPDPEPWPASKWHGELTRCSQGHGDEFWTQWPCVEVRALAAVYSDHPDYDPAWA